MKLNSPDFSEGGNIPERFTCDGKDMSPTLKIDGVPKEAKSLVFIVDDPDAPGGNFSHWLMWNVAPDVTEIVANRLPSHAVQGVGQLVSNTLHAAEMRATARTAETAATTRIGETAAIMRTGETAATTRTVEIAADGTGDNRLPLEDRIDHFRK
ncbi:MAG: YbhB/YbcL family Raf kinase inhibitor-like protein [Terrimicrobiaceae bacterium]